MQTTWGNWHLDIGSLELVHEADEYRIDLERTVRFRCWTGFFRSPRNRAKCTPHRTSPICCKPCRTFSIRRPTYAVMVSANGSTSPRISSNVTGGKPVNRGGDDRLTGRTSASLQEHRSHNPCPPPDFRGNFTTPPLARMPRQGRRAAAIPAAIASRPAPGRCCPRPISSGGRYAPRDGQ